MQQQLLDLAVEKLDNIEQYFENRTDYNDNFGYLTSITTLKDAVNKLTKELNKQVSNGVIKEFSNEWFEAMSQINSAQEKLFEATIKKYQDIIDNLTRISDTLDNSIALQEARDEPISESTYQKQIDLSNKSIQEMYDKRQALLKQQAIYDVGSVKYDELAEDIADIDDDIYGLLTNIEELKDKIWEVRWQPFFDGQEALADLVDETDEFRDLLDSKAFVSETGGLTADGITNLYLLSSAMNSAKQSIRNYQAGLENLQKDYDKGNISLEEFNETSKDFINNIADNVSVVESYRDSIISLYTEMLEKENDVVQASIQKYSDLLDIKKKNADYNKTVRDQTKDINVLKSQISALQGVNNESAKSQLKLLQQQLKEAEDALSETQKDREYDVRQQGYDSLSEDLTDAMNESLDAVKYNASEQERVISEMLNHVVNNYADAYNKINQIIANTGFTPSSDFQQNINNLGTQSGAQNQVNDSNTIAPDYTPDDFVTGTVTDKIQSDSNQATNDKIESVIEQEPNTTNRPVAQITLKPTSVSIQEGVSTTISATIRPTDAKNKSVKWSSSNTSVATVSGGVVKGIKSGSAKITCTATDGSGVSASCSVTVTAKPKPKPTTPSNSSGGDGVPKVGDAVKYVKGSYYYSSTGAKPTGHEMLGQTVYIGIINSRSWATKPYALYRDRGFTRPLGWVSLDQISGYATGTKGIKNPVELAKVNEVGDEMIIRRGSDTYAELHYGDAVVPAQLTNNLFTLAEHKNAIMDGMLSKNINHGQEVVIQNHYDSLLTVNGDIDKETFPGVKKMCEEAYQYTSKKMYRDANLMGYKKTL